MTPTWNIIVQRGLKSCSPIHCSIIAINCSRSSLWHRRRRWKWFERRHMGRQWITTCSSSTSASIAEIASFYVLTPPSFIQANQLVLSSFGQFGWTRHRPRSREGHMHPLTALNSKLSRIAHYWYLTANLHQYAGYLIRSTQSKYSTLDVLNSEPIALP